MSSFDLYLFNVENVLSRDDFFCAVHQKPSWNKSKKHFAAADVIFFFLRGSTKYIKEMT